MFHNIPFIHNASGKLTAIQEWKYHNKHRGRTKNQENNQEKELNINKTNRIQLISTHLYHKVIICITNQMIFILMGGI